MTTDTQTTRPRRTITVCSACLKASCWHMEFPCQNYDTAGTVEMTRAELRKLDREHPDYWKGRSHVSE